MELFRRNRIFSRYTAIVILSVFALVFIGFALIRSPTFIIPPTDPANPTTVYVIDYGYHSRLILPDRQDGLLQYTYGDWHYFALNQQDLSDGLAALLIPTVGTLGRKRANDITELRQELGSDWQDTLLSFEVTGTQAAQLLESLNERFNQNIDTRIVNSRNNLAFVQDDQDYILFHNSNHELVNWLEELDCQIEGFITLPNFKVKHSEN